MKERKIDFEELSGDAADLMKQFKQNL